MISSNLSGQNMMRYVTEMARYGNRWLGTPAERKVRQYIEEKFKQNGLEEVHLEEVDYPSYMPRLSKLTVTHPITESIRCEPLEYSANKTVEGDLIYIGTGSADEILALERAGVTLTGKIVMTSSFFPWDLVPMAEEKGATGIIIATDPPADMIRMLAGKFPGNLDEPDRHVTATPGISVSVNGAQKLWSLMSRGPVKVRVEHQGVNEVKQSSNVLGMVRGTKLPEETLVIGGHYDSQMYGPLVWDNLTGIATLIEIGRAFAKTRPLRSVIFAAFTAEEPGLWGSLSYVKAHEEDLKKNCVAMLNADALGSVFPAGRAVWAQGKFLDLILRKAREVGWEIQTTYSGPWIPWSDFAPFLRLDIPAAYILEFPPLNPHYHTERETLEFVNADKMAKQASVYEAVATELAYEPGNPLSSDTS